MSISAFIISVGLGYIVGCFYIFIKERAYKRKKMNKRKKEV